MVGSGSPPAIQKTNIPDHMILPKKKKNFSLHRKYVNFGSPRNSPKNTRTDIDAAERLDFSVLLCYIWLKGTTLMESRSLPAVTDLELRPEKGQPLMLPNEPESPPLLSHVKTPLASKPKYHQIAIKGKQPELV